ncbi:MAG: M48 family metallopeptidase [Chryseobacterium sp.]
MNQNKLKSRRFFFWGIILFCSFVFIVLFSSLGSPQNSEISFSPIFQLLGKAPQSVSRSVTKVLPIDSVDEGELGTYILSHYDDGSLKVLNEDKALDYLVSVGRKLERYKRKPFPYVLRLEQSELPNAMALPGGVILVTSGLLKVLKSESELVSVLAHEMGHVELSHCFDAVKYEILTKKILNTDLGMMADFARNFLIKHSFSKTQEDEADSYGFQLLSNSEYDPTSLSRAFLRLNESSSKSYTNTSANPLRDYFSSHPPLQNRIEKFSSEAQIWWTSHRGQSRYIGVQNFIDKVDLSQKDYGSSERISFYKKDL